MDIPIMTKPMTISYSLAFLVVLIELMLGSFLKDNISTEQAIIIEVILVVLTIVTLSCLATNFLIFELILFEGA
jgi:uncharacterized membrane protein